MEVELNEAQLLELEGLKKKYGKVRTLFVPLDDEDETKVAIFFLRKPDRTVRSMVDSFVSKGASDKAIESALKALRVGGDELSVVLNNDDAMASLDFAMADLFRVYMATLKKN